MGEGASCSTRQGLWPWGEQPGAGGRGHLPWDPELAVLSAGGVCGGEVPGLGGAAEAKTGEMESV